MNSLILHSTSFNSITMWPMRLELSRDECKKCLRCLDCSLRTNERKMKNRSSLGKPLSISNVNHPSLEIKLYKNRKEQIMEMRGSGTQEELEAYGNMVSVLRAQGFFTNEKQKLLQELAKALHISNERHRAEVRRAVNDEKLSTIAEQLNGPNTGTDWAIEGRRTIPLLPRLNACTVFTSLANSLSLATSVANAKKASTSREEVAADVRVKVETESEVEKLEDNEMPVNTTSTQLEDHSISRKRRRSRVELQDVSSNVNQLDDISNIVKEVATSFSRIGSESPSPVPVSLSNKVFIVSTNSAPDIPRNNIVDEIAEINTVNSSCSTTITTTHQTTPVHPSGSTCIGSNSTVPCKAVISQNTSYTHVPAQVSRSLSTVVATYVTATAASKIRAKVISTRTKIQPRTTSIVIPTCGSQSVVTKSIPSDISDVQISNDGDRNMKLVQLTSCVQKAPKSSSSTSSACVRRITTTTHSSARAAIGVKPISSQTGPRMVTVNTGVASSGPGPPHIRPTGAVLTCKKMPAVKTGHQATKMGITLNSNKTVNISSNPGSRVAAKANVIVVQKGPARGVTLSHAGKEVLGKVIMGGKNLCLSNQQSAGSIALLPHRISANGEQSLTMLSPINSSQTESVKTNTKSGNMIVFDLRQDSLEKSKVLSEILEASGVFSSESKTAILNTNSHLLIKDQNKDAQTPTSPINKSSHMKSGATISFLMDSKEHRKNKETVANIDSDKAESPAESKIEDSEEILASSDCISEIQGTLDPQTGIYSFQAPENSMSNIQADESISSSGIDIFSTALASADINLESFQYIDDNESNIVLDDVRNQILTIDQLNDLYDSHQSISDKSNC